MGVAPSHVLWGLWTEEKGERELNIISILLAEDAV